eukprot:TRINITY_DN5142_c0_g1_i1.p2 TRINITY_DN5142_c0_g1~~TRINITY_DN5142_c0_g1_i1.p2  ORF type:complete len:176 (-),score=25.68 TRINITY_DN5142_c0_g1_i1:32-559(-)
MNNRMFEPMVDLLFEQYAHTLLAQGGEFSVRNLHDKTEKKIQIYPKQVKEVGTFSYAEPNTYYLPHDDKPSFACVDSWIPECGLFQMTVSKAHPIDITNFCTHISTILESKSGSAIEGRRINYYFVVPDDMYPDFQLQKITYREDKKRCNSLDFDSGSVYEQNIVQNVLRIDVEG